MRVRDLRATLFKLMGVGHTRLTYRSARPDFRLTDVPGQRGGTRRR